MKSKILVCGSAGFVLSNFIRFFLYRTKGYEIISVDNLENEKDSRNLYIHKNHNYYIGNICDYDFMKKIIKFHEPDIIINGTNCIANLINQADFIKGVSILNSFALPVIQLLPALNNDNDMWKYIESITNNLCIEFPNCFGRRQKTNQGIGYLLKQINDNGNVYVSDVPLSWVFVEDVASLIWFCLEREKRGLIKMPQLGLASTSKLVNIIKEITNIPIKTIYQETYWCDVCFDYESNLIEGWQPESNELMKRIEETVRWYDANKWAMI